MALFRKDDDAPAPRGASPGPAGQVNIIGQGTTIEGGLTATSDVRIAGRVVGTVRVEGKTVVTPEGEVEGEIRSTQADVAGRVRGEVVVEDRLVLKGTARVEGNLHTKKLVIEEGAQFTGSCDMSGALPKPAEEGRPRLARPAEAAAPALPPPASA